MPVKRRVNKRRVDPDLAREFWEGVLSSGHDFFGDAAELGISTDEYGRPSRAEAEAAWRQYGPNMAAEAGRCDAALWAATEFGPPWEAER